MLGNWERGVREICRSGWFGWIKVRIGNSGCGIVDLDVAHTEVAQDLILCGHSQNLRVRLRQTEAFVVQKKESVLSDEGASEGGSEVVLHQMIVSHGAKGARIACAVAKKLIDRSVVLVGTRVRDNVDLTPACASHIRRVAAGFHLEFFYRVRRGAQVLGVEGRIGVGRPVQQEKVRIRATAANDNRRALAGTPVKRIRRAGLRAKPHVGAGYGEHKIDQHSPVERKFADGLRLNHLANAGVGGVQYFICSRDIDSLLHRTHGQIYRDAQFLPHLKPKSLLALSKAGCFRGEFVVIWQERQSFKQAALVRNHMADCAGAGGSQLDRGSYNRQVLRIRNRTRNAGIVALTEGR